MNEQRLKEFKAIGLRCDYRENPIGIDNTAPRLSWKMKAYGQDRAQSAYRVLAAAAEDGFEGSLLWDSGKVPCDKSVGIIYGGPTLSSRVRVYWKVQIWDENDVESVWSECAFFEMGLLNEADWSAKWICAPNDVTAPYFRKAWQSVNKPVSGRVYICGLGYYELYMTQFSGNEI